MTPDQKTPELFELLMPDEIYLSWPAWRDYGVLNAHLVPELLDNPVKYIRADLVSKPASEEITGLEEGLTRGWRDLSADYIIHGVSSPAIEKAALLFDAVWEAARRYASQHKEWTVIWLEGETLNLPGVLSRAQVREILDARGYKHPYHNVSINWHRMIKQEGRLMDFSDLISQSRAGKEVI